MRTPCRQTGLLAMSMVVALAAPAHAVEPPVADERARDAIALLDSKDEYQRQVGFLRLEALRDPSTLDVVRRYTGHQDHERRAHAVRALAAIGRAEVVPELLEAMTTDRHPSVRRAALLGLEPLVAARPDVVPSLLAALRDRKPEVRMTAVDIVSRIDSQEARDAIRDRRRRERDRNVQRVLLLAINRIGDG